MKDDDGGMVALSRLKLTLVDVSGAVSVDSPLDDGMGPGDGLGGPTPKRRRVTRACDECRRKKIKCDGKQVSQCLVSHIH
jgi:Fungal Zn(2)-Cys(6) binuclear cluster domain